MDYVEPKIVTCPICGYESAEATVSRFTFAGDEPDLMLMAIIPVADCPICSQRTPLKDPHEAHREMIQMCHESKRAAEEALNARSAAVKEFFQRCTKMAFIGGLTTGYAIVMGMDIIAARKGNVALDIIAGTLMGVFGLVTTIHTFRLLGDFNNRLTVANLTFTEGQTTKSKTI